MTEPPNPSATSQTKLDPGTHGTEPGAVSAGADLYELSSPKVIPRSPSVAAVAASLANHGPIGAWDVAQAILARHAEYGDGRASELASEPGPASRDQVPVHEWLERMDDLFDGTKVTELHGRLLILGLAHCDQDLRTYLARRGFLDALKRELREPFGELLALRPDRAPLHIDSPSPEDRLGRQAFARALAFRIDDVWRDYQQFGIRNSFVLHLHGPWGAGKTSLLNLLRAEFQSNERHTRPIGDSSPAVDDQREGPTNADHTARRQPPRAAHRRRRWVVVDFNAWQHQRLDPPWWPLVDLIYREARRQLGAQFGAPIRAAWLQVSELWWRIFTRRSDVVITLIAAAIIVVVIGFALSQPLVQGLLRGATASTLSPGRSQLERVGDYAKATSSVLAVLATVVSAVLMATRSLVTGSARSARQFVDTSADSLGEIRRHFGKVARRIDYPIIVFIDDLDRCQRQYVVGLLEGIQTLFHDPRVVYVVSADRRWLQVCFEQTYAEFASTVNEPGRRLGSLFLEKAFQLSVSVPVLSADLKQEYWDFLLEGDDRERNQRIAEVRARARQALLDASNEQEILTRQALVEGDGSLSPRLVHQLAREAAVERMADAQVERSTEYFLKAFAPLLEPNPRSMKRFVNAYAIYRDLAVLGGLNLVDVETRKRLALWTIVALRWPLLQEYLIALSAKPGLEPPSDVVGLIRSQAVQNVFGGRGVGVGLSNDSVRQFASMMSVQDDTSVIA